MRIIIALLGVLTFFVSPALAAKPKPKAQAAPRIAYVKVPQETYENVLLDLIHESDRRWHEGDFEGVVTLLKMVTDLDPGDVENWSNRAWVFWSALDRDKDAFEVFRQGISANPKSGQLYFERGQLYDHRKEYAKAAGDYRKALELSNDWRYRHALAHALELSGKVAEAKEVWRQAIKANPKDEPAHKNLQRLEQGDIRKPKQDPPPAAPEPSSNTSI